jgi:hypothetical protein
MIQVIRIALKYYAHSTKAIDACGRLPLHHAVLVGAPLIVVRILVNHDPGTVLCPDQGMSESFVRHE